MKIILILWNHITLMKHTPVTTLLTVILEEYHMLLEALIETVIKLRLTNGYLSVSSSTMD